jgi:hypothetical protein
MEWAQRAELHRILHYCSEPCTTPEEYSLKQAILHFLNGRDAEALLAEHMPLFVARRIANKARVWLGNERSKRRARGRDTLLAERSARPNPKFTSENFRVTMDTTQNKDYGAMKASIYCTVEVFLEDDSDVPEKEYLINFSDGPTKEWLTRLMVWALMNKREVLLKPAGEAEMNSMKMFLPKDKVPA